eukprot:4489428-Prorocentrum_lima.AAC.1
MGNQRMNFRKCNQKLDMIVCDIVNDPVAMKRRNDRLVGRTEIYYQRPVYYHPDVPLKTSCKARA